MGCCVIFCAGGFSGLARPLGEDDFVIAADGGLRHTQALGLQPDVVLGDFDSLGYTPTGAEVFPVEKDDTDAMLAVKLGLSRGYTDFLLYGSLDGARLDHTVANFQTLQYLADHASRGYLVGLREIATVVSGEILRFPAHREGLLSVFCLGAPAEDVSILGLQYTLEHGTLTAGYPLGVSNHFVGNCGEISAKNGSLLVIWQRELGFPKERELWR